MTDCQSTSISGRVPRTVGRICGPAIVAALIALSATPSFAQEQRVNPAAASELGRVNLSHVAASAQQIRAILVEDAGLMVELKRWVAKDATDHGQIVTDSDLSDDAIFDRLTTDVEFRAVATQLLQRYGYLVPKINPDSAMGQEQALFLQEQAKWMAEEDEEERTAQRQLEAQEVQKARACSAGITSDCTEQQPASPNPSATPPPAANGAAPVNGPELTPNAPTAPSWQPPLMPNLPSGNGNNNQLQQAQLMQTSEESEGDSSLFGLGIGTGTGNSAGAQQDSDNLGQMSPFGSSASSSSSTGQQASAGGDFFQSSRAGFSMNDGSGAQGSTGFPLFGESLAEEGTELGEPPTPTGLESLSPAHPAGTPVVPYQTLGRPMQSQAAVQPVMMRVPDPYRDIPSLYDMYLQASPRPATPTRFGMDVFENGTRDPELIPMDLPAGPDYVVGPGDGLSIDLWGGVSQRFYRTVDREGRVTLPEVGPVLVSGKSLADVQEEVQRVLRTQFREISADVTLARLRTIRIYEVGDVTRPGAYDISSLSTPLNALFAAGGPTPQGSLRIVEHYRGDQLVQSVDLYDLLLHGVKAAIAPLQNGDTVMVPPVGPQVSIEGMVRRPAIYELKDEKTLASVIALAGGLLPAATLRHIEVQRLVAHQKQTMLSVDVPETDDDAAVTQKLESFQIQDGDRIRIFPVAPYNQNAVYLEGHVLRPGRYSYRDGMRVTDLISSYKDVLPEPSTSYAEIIRLNMPDFHPSVESFDLAEALANPSSAPLLHPLDTVRIFSRFDFENPPVVSVLGDVRAPGTYQTSGVIHLSDAVHLARGLEPDAETEDAQVFRSLPEGQVRILSVNLGEALAGVPSANIALESRDRILIHRSPDAIQPASVFIEGEVGRPGRYPLTTNMTVADLIRAGGGLTPGADTQVGDLTTYAWASGTKLSGQQEPIQIAAALKGDADANVALQNGDVVTIRQLSGWSDLGASISVRGAVKHPGTYGIRPGERLSSILERAGGFQPDAYPYGALLERAQVRQLEADQQDQLILRVKDAETGLEQMPDTTPQQKQAKEAVLAQYHTTLTQLGASSPIGRVTIQISSDIKRWRNTASDIQVQAGDVLMIPTRPSYVMVTGQVFNPTAISYHPGKSAKWYLQQAGGPTTVANRKAIFVIRADGSVLGGKESLWSGDSLNAALRPGDSVVVPERALGGGVQWQSVFTTASLASSIVSTAVIAARY
ncbi:MAG TPA: SLBB domain-containing protein [Candidatus Sulfotelmatobacter sp.]|nr:SLBB domain-containing protein [Candidatus Sulfotelmatobacter sp.]